MNTFKTKEISGTGFTLINHNEKRTANVTLVGKSHTSRLQIKPNGITEVKFTLGPDRFLAA